MTTHGDSVDITESGPDDLARGTVVGSWQVEDELGRGGMGTVYAVRHVMINKTAALKVVHREVLTRGGYPASAMLTEARAVNAFQHPNVVEIFDTGTMDDGRTYLVMERLHGCTLGDRQADSRVPALEAIDYLIPLCDALAAAHAAGIVHRDIKLDNVFLAEARGEGRKVNVKLLDWGVASITAGPGGRSGDRLTIGTPRYVAPEQVRGEGVTSASDIYALGVLAYELFLEESPFDAATTAELLLAHVNDPPPPPRDTWPRIPAALEELLLAMLAKDPMARPTATCVGTVLVEVRDQLRRASMDMTPSSPRARMVPTPARSSRTQPTFGPTKQPTFGSTMDVGVLATARRAPWTWLMPVALIVAGLGLRSFLAAPDTVAEASAATEPASPVPFIATTPAPAMTPTLAVVTDEAPVVVQRTTVRPAPTAIARRSLSTVRSTTGNLLAGRQPSRLRPDDLIEPY